MMNFIADRPKKMVQLFVFLIGFFFLLSGILEVTKSPVTYAKTIQMGYPPYFILLLGIVKIAGVAALWQRRVQWLQEWAFAGFAFDTVFAFFSDWSIHSFADCLKAAVSFAVIMVTFHFKRQQTFRTNKSARMG